MNVEQFLADARLIADSARGPFLTKLQTALSLLRNYSPSKVPEGFTLAKLLQKWDKQSGGQFGGKLNGAIEQDRKGDEWLILFVAGMWFQDLWTYDFRRTEMCIIPYATQMGEISFCAYNTGVGWRQIVEKMYQNATVAEWYKEHGKHTVYANPRKSVPLADATPVSLKIPRDGRLVDWLAARPAPSPPVKPQLSEAGLPYMIRWFGGLPTCCEKKGPEQVCALPALIPTRGLPELIAKGDPEIMDGVVGERRRILDTNDEIVLPAIEHAEATPHY